MLYTESQNYRSIMKNSLLPIGSFEILYVTERLAYCSVFEGVDIQFYTP